MTPSIDSGSVMRTNVRRPRRAERRRRLAQARIDLRERRGDRLHGERQAVEHRGDDQAFERERQRVPGPLRPPSSERAARAHGHQQIEAEHGRRQHERQRDDRFDQERPAAAREREPVGERAG